MKFKLGKFSTAGLDPLGVGVPDIPSVSKLDYAGLIKSGWDKSREERIIRDKERREDFQKRSAELPTFEAVNQKVAASLNQKAADAEQYMIQMSKSGDFAPFARTGTRDDDGKRLKTRDALEHTMQNLDNEGRAYKALLPDYKEALEYRKNPEKHELIDIDETDKRIKAAAEASDVEGMTEAMRKGLIVLKPKPVEYNNWVTSIMEETSPGVDLDATETTDPKTGKITKAERTFTNPTKVAQNLIQRYNNADDTETKYVKENQRRYDYAVKNNPKSVTTEIAGVDVKMTPADFFAAEHVPQYGEKIRKSTKFSTKKGTGSKAKFTFDYAPRLQNGNFDLTGRGSVNTYGRERTIEGKESTENINYASIETIPLQGLFKKAIELPNTLNTINTKSGKTTKEVSRTSSNKPVQVTVDPVFTESYTSKTGDKYKAGEIIPMDVFDEMRANNNEKATYKAFLRSSTSNKKTTRDIGDYEYKPESYDESTLRPWNEVKRALKTQASTQGLSFKEIEEYIDGVLNQSNRKLESWGVEPTISEGDDALLINKKAFGF